MRPDELFDDRVVMLGGCVEDYQSPLSEAEAELAAPMASARHAQFVAGRTLARAALARLGGLADDLLRTDGGAPIWPAGFVGSITHCGSGQEAWCGVAVAHRSEWLSLGLDAEPATALRPDLRSRVLRASEAKNLAPQDGLAAKLIFSAKECVYKCLDPLAHTFLDFHDVEIDLDPDTGRFSARVLREPWPPGVPTTLAGRYRTDEGLIITAVAV